MEVKKILIIFSLSCFVLGTFLLYTFSLNFKPKKLRISEIEKSMIGQTISVSGRIVEVYRSKKGHIFLKLEDEGRKLSVVIFSNLAKNLPKELKSKLKVNQWLRVIGKVQEYKGRLEIIPKKPSDLKPL